MRIIANILIYILIVHSSVFAQNTGNNLDEDMSSAVVLMYHRFGDARYPSTNITLEQFEQHLKYLQDNNFTVWPLSKILNYIAEVKNFPKKIVAITMDDAYNTTYTNAYPRLKAKKFPFTVFVNTRAIDTKSKNYISWEHMREMSLNGAEFANHSLTHAYLIREKSETKESWEKRAKGEIEGAQKRLQQELGDSTNTKPKLFSYPFGEYNQEVADLLKELGYIGVTQTSGVVDSNSDLRALPRFPMAEAFGNKKGFILKVNTLPLATESVSPTEPLVTLQNPPILEINFKHHMKNLGCFTANGERINVKWFSQTQVQVQAKEPLDGPRDRYTCTAPAKDGKWYWYSHLWIIK